MSEPREQKNYASLRGSRAFGERKDCIGLRLDKAEFIEWLKKLPDTQGFIKLNITPRRTPSEANAFTLYEDTWKPDFNSQREPAARPAREPDELPRTQAGGDGPPEDGSDVPF